ncbi:MAG: RNA polymerase sigma factor [Clostridia bacterium]
MPPSRPRPGTAPGSSTRGGSGAGRSVPRLPHPGVGTAGQLGLARSWGDPGQSKRTKATLEASPGGDGSRLPSCTGPEPRGDLLDAVQSLPPPYREATLLYYWASFDVRETAQMLRVSQGTVKSRLARSRERLKRWLGAEDGEVRHGR